MKCILSARVTIRRQLAVALILLPVTMPVFAEVAKYEGPIKVAVTSFLLKRDDLLPLRPIIVYGWATDPSISQYESQCASLESITDWINKNVKPRNWIRTSGADPFYEIEKGDVRVASGA